MNKIVRKQRLILRCEHPLRLFRFKIFWSRIFYQPFLARKPFKVFGVEYFVENALGFGVFKLYLLNGFFPEADFVLHIYRISVDYNTCNKRCYNRRTYDGNRDRAPICIFIWLDDCHKTLSALSFMTIIQ